MASSCIGCRFRFSVLHSGRPRHLRSSGIREPRFLHWGRRRRWLRLFRRAAAHARRVSSTWGQRGRWRLPTSSSKHSPAFLGARERRRRRRSLLVPGRAGRPERSNPRCLARRSITREGAIHQVGRHGIASRAPQGAGEVSERGRLHVGQPGNIVQQEFRRLPESSRLVAGRRMNKLSTETARDSIT